MPREKGAESNGTVPNNLEVSVRRGQFLEGRICNASYPLRLMGIVPNVEKQKVIQSILIPKGGRQSAIVQRMEGGMYQTTLAKVAAIIS